LLRGALNHQLNRHLPTLKGVADNSAGWNVDHPSRTVFGRTAPPGAGVADPNLMRALENSSSLHAAPWRLQRGAPRRSCPQFGQFSRRPLRKSPASSRAYIMPTAPQPEPPERPRSAAASLDIAKKWTATAMASRVNPTDTGSGSAARSAFRFRAATGITSRRL
jgi:hypothetical protein